MEFPTEISHMEEIEEDIVEDGHTETIVLSADTSRPSASNQKVVLIQTPQGVRRTVRVQQTASTSSPAASSGVQFVKTDAGIIQVRTGAANTAQRGPNVVVKKHFIATQKPKPVAPQTVTKTITMAQAQQLGLITQSGVTTPGNKVVQLNPTIKQEPGTVKVLNASPQVTRPIKAVQIPSGSSQSRLSTVRPAAAKPGQSLQYIEVMPSPSTTIKQEKVSSQAAEILMQLEGSVVLPANSQKVVMLPNDYVEQLLIKQNPTEEEEAMTEMADVVDESDIIIQSSSPPPADIEVPKKRPCNCTRSQCLKLYCECFANGEFCQNCNCKDCSNTLDFEELRQEAIYQCLARNPNAFRPKIGKASSATIGLRHHKGCHCKRSGCLKNYCECFEAKIPCSDMCKCVDCKNSDENCSNLNSAVMGSGKTASAIKRAAAAMDGEPRFKATEDDDPPPKAPYNFMTADVVDATVQCMMAQADECQQNGVSYRNTERLILEEFGRCLAEIIDFSTKNTE